MSRIENSILDYFEEDMKARPTKWRADGFSCRNDLGDEIWTANGFYGVHLRVNGSGEIGGVTMTSSIFGWATPWRRRALRLARRSALELLAARAALLKAKGE